MPGQFSDEHGGEDGDNGDDDGHGGDDDGHGEEDGDNGDDDCDKVDNSVFGHPDGVNDMVMKTWRGCLWCRRCKRR